MNTKRPFSLLAVAFLAIGLVACSTLEKPETLAQDLESAAMMGTSLHLRDNEGDRSKFEDARSQLAILASNTNATPTDLVGIVQSLPLKGDAIFYREGALMILRRVSLPNVPQAPGSMGLLIAGLDRGIQSGLNAVEASKAVKTKVSAARSRGAPTNSAPRVP